MVRLRNRNLAASLVAVAVVVIAFLAAAHTRGILQSNWNDVADSPTVAVASSQVGGAPDDRLPSDEGSQGSVRTRGGGVSLAFSGAAVEEVVVRGGRFPRYGTHKFARRCGWLVEAAAKAPRPDSNNCTFYYSPTKYEYEGISFWATQIVSSHLLAIQAGCRLLFDYGPTVEMGQVLIPAEARYNWTVPAGFKCEDDPQCYQIPRHLNGKTLTVNVTARDEPLASVPRYRYAYGGSGKHVFGGSRFRRRDNLTADLERVLPGFNVEDGMACSLGALLQLAPSALLLETGLSKTVMPALHDEEALVLGVYVRTNWADYTSYQKRNSSITRGLFSADGSAPTDKMMEGFRTIALDTINTALKIEREFLSGRMVEPPLEKGHRDVRRVVWMVSTDSPHIKEWIHNEYDGKDCSGSGDARNEEHGKNESPSTAVVAVPRAVLTTRSRGRHTRAAEGPSTADFAGAFLDWWLLGETDLVITQKLSYAETAAMRTARPLFRKGRFTPLLG